MGLNIFDFLDTLATNIMLPIVSILICLYMGWSAPKELFGNQLTNHGSVRMRLYPSVLFIVRYLAPLLIAIVLVGAFI